MYFYNKGIMVGATDSRFYNNNTKNIYKYLPIRLTLEDTKGYLKINKIYLKKNKS